MNSLSLANFQRCVFFLQKEFQFFWLFNLAWETKHIIFSSDKIREQMRSEMENISEKKAEEGGVISEC